MREVLENLLAGRFICRYSAPELYSELCSVSYARAIEQALQPLGRTLGWLGSVEQPSAFFSRFVNLSNANDRAAASEEFKHIRDAIWPVVEFIQLCARAGRGDACLAPGEEVHTAEILTQVENSSICADQLRDLAGHTFFRKSKRGESHSEKLSVVLKTMEEQGFLVRKGAASSIYVATGKMAYLYRAMSWIVEHQKLVPADESDAASDTQSELIL
ncbi:hypothetical protein [Pseudomonas monteilii]|uniref:hypothetical protein n=1 Tax=Pseudomonas monteilii TaxID=76759 RepID=UPI001E4BBE77|nr:hypothetical protein [Pseudomonas monteilii]MCE0877413.1 hypothetical protein [Pseudomonas monteilii]MCE0929599.1 hypothetical protein [Pseudomonas monteilii]MCE1015793.1 hypothetical protein [Pseudomonas monteilii]MCE1044480.1 hypothetical protein [Pseudomonas monteilii]WJR47619.1 hypothetical protein LU654_013895 [Pseudomonas monteilii]